jgi:hypothetical protein
MMSRESNSLAATAVRTPERAADAAEFAKQLKLVAGGAQPAQLAAPRGGLRRDELRLNRIGIPKSVEF